MKSLVIDSSSAILLFKAGVFDIVIKYFSVFMPDSVYNELIVSGHSGRTEFIDVHQKKLIRVIRDESEYLSPETNDSLIKMGTGERNAISLFYLVRADFILIDDGRGARYCKQNKIPFVNALLMVKILYYSKCLNFNKFKKVFHVLKTIGRYSERIMQFAEQCEKSDLIQFLC